MLVNKDDELLVRSEALALRELRGAAKAFIANPTSRPDFPDDPRKAMISLRNDRATSYAAYVAVYNELLGAYRELWEEAARGDYGASYASLGASQQEAIRSRIPLVLSEAEPTDFGDD